VRGARPMSHAPLVTATSARDTSGRRVNGARCVTYEEVRCHSNDIANGVHDIFFFSFMLSLLSTPNDTKQTWKRRWFVLRPAHLAYYKTSAEYQLHRLLDLQDVHTCTPVALKRRENTFGVVTATRTYYLQAESQEDARAWVMAIREAKEAQLAPVSTTSTLPIPIPGRPRIPAITPSPPSRGLHITSSESEEGSPNTQRVVTLSSSLGMPSSTSPRIGGPDASKVVMSGYITKMGKRRNWRKRWFLLNGEMLMYASSHMVSDNKASAGDRCGSPC
jgi:pleckstrin homology domain-containing family A member 1/2